jgi:outer membrane protein OmpA-like peptidoglycan-associated protein
MFKIRKRSAWTWNSSAGTSVGVEFINVGKGTFSLTAPDGGVAEFSYATMGFGLGKGRPLNQSSSTDTVDVGRLYVLEKFAGAELTTSDIQGLCLVQEASIGAGVGASATAMLLGIPESSLPKEILKNTGAAGAGAQFALDHPEILLGPLGIIAQDKIGVLDKVLAILNEQLRSDAKALLVMAGSNKGQQLQAGISGSVGYVKLAKMQQPKPVPPPPPPPPPPPRKDWIVLHLPADVLFGFDRSDLKPEAKKVLEDIENQIRAKSPSRVSVEGHTDGLGDGAYNMELSRRRAQSVSSWLLARKVIPASKLGTHGFGMLHPIAPNTRQNGADNPEGRAQNRRVEVWLMKY